jgi:HK97 family phage prohead protease
MLFAAEKGVSFAVKSVDSKARRFAGLASTWELDQGNDMIHPGAFAKTLSDWRGGKRRTIHLLDSHKRTSQLDVLGKLVSAQETATGLEAEFEMRDTQNANDALKAIEGGFIDGLSIGYQPIGDPTFEKAANGKTIRHLKEIKLYEISLVVDPMNEGARVDPSSVKSIIDAAIAGQLTQEQWAELLALHKAAATSDVETPEAPKGIAPNDPRRIALDEQLRALKLRSLTV